MYNFVKGKGWVLGPEIDFREFGFNGVKWRIEARDPNPGERYIYAKIDNRFYVKNNAPNLDGWLDYFKYLNPDSLTRWSQDSGLVWQRELCRMVTLIQC